MRVVSAVLLCLAASVGAADPNIWPLPKAFKNGTTLLHVDPTSFTFEGGASPSADLTAAFARYTAQMFTHRVETVSGASVSKVTVSVKNDKAALQLGVDESYTLEVGADASVAITAETQFGAYHAMETLSQLVTFDFDGQVYQLASAPWSIQDAPRFAHREVLVDTSRHYQPVASLKMAIDSFTYAKVNTMHWHIVDEQSFPYQGPTHPELAQKGAYSKQERYTQNDVKDVVEYARARGVRVLFEVDTPGHAASWCKGQPDICPSATCTMPLRPDTNKTFDVIEAVFKDLAAASIDDHMHIGGDEVNTACWTKTPEVAAWLKAKNMTADQGYAYFSGRVSNIVLSMGKSVTGWEELWKHFGTKLDKKTIIQQWLPGSTIVKDATAAGYRVIWSTDGVWYLDGLGVTWEKMYVQEPCSLVTADVCEKLVLGGGGEMWGETVDASDFQNTVWPRMAAIAERLWSPRTVTDTTAAAPRISYFRCLLNHRGIGAAPTKNSRARESPPGPGSCYDQ